YDQVLYAQLDQVSRDVQRRRGLPVQTGGQGLAVFEVEADDDSLGAPCGEQVAQQLLGRERFQTGNQAGDVQAIVLEPGEFLSLRQVAQASIQPELYPGVEHFGVAVPCRWGAGDGVQIGD